MQDQYGNYVIQYVLEKGSPNDKSAIIAGIYGQVLHLSKHKFASNVVEKCITNANEHEIHLIATECLAPRNDGATGIQSMLRHEYANYVLQRLIKHTTGQVQALIVGQVYEQLAFYRTANPPFIAKHLAAGRSAQDPPVPRESRSNGRLVCHLQLKSCSLTLRHKSSRASCRDALRITTCPDATSVHRKDPMSAEVNTLASPAEPAHSRYQPVVIDMPP